jgi:hypothetical protein
LIGLRAAPKSIAVTNPAPKGFEVVATSRGTGPPIASAYHLTRAGRRRDRSQPPPSSATPSSATRTHSDGARDTLKATAQPETRAGSIGSCRRHARSRRSTTGLPPVPLFQHTC